VGSESSTAAPQIPIPVVGRIAVGGMLAQALLVAADLDVAGALGDQGLTPMALADKVGADAKALTRILRFLATQGVFEERDGRVYNTSASALLRKDHPQSRRGTVRSLHFMQPILAALEHSVRTGRPAVEVLHPDGLWTWLAKNPALGRIFDETMASRAAVLIPAVLAAYDFTSLGLIADIGGGRGQLMRAVLAAAPRAHGIVFDLPQVVADADPSDNDRLTFRSGDFLRDPLPAADAYLLMNIIHDWGDAESLAILKAVRRTAAPGSKLLLIEMLVPEPGAGAAPTPAPDPLFVIASDVTMMATTTGRERRLSEYQILLDGSGWRFERTLPAPPLSIIESVAG
jgi:O-methyltransferase domain